ncbi:MAG: hypothetical protein JW860_01550, partial [Sedimentisphaerales bacterium]|nr:hypothetical protein [Sedimentisphaerales bacterium]
GYVYAPEFAGRKNIFGGHAWCQAWIGGQWIGLDATRAPDGYSAVHITLLAGSGNPEDFFDMVNTLNSFQITEIKQE